MSSWDNFCNKTIRKAKNISDVEFEQAKKQYLEDADAKMILYALEHLSDIEFIKPIIVTEETKYGNDGKLFKKIPEFIKSLKKRVILLITYSFSEFRNS